MPQRRRLCQRGGEQNRSSGPSWLPFNLCLGTVMAAIRSHGKLFPSLCMLLCCTDYNSASYDIASLSTLITRVYSNKSLQAISSSIPVIRQCAALTGKGMQSCLLCARMICSIPSQRWRSSAQGLRWHPLHTDRLGRRVEHRTSLNNQLARGHNGPRAEFVL